MAKKLPKKNSKKILAFDLGGTKLAVAVVNSHGKIIVEMRAPVVTENGVKGLIQQMTDMGRLLIDEYQIKQVGIASAGPLDPVNGLLLNPTNLKTMGKEWGVVPIVRELEKKLKLPVKLENDAASAALAESWVGAGKNCDDFAVVTLGTGLGVAVIANGQLVRAGRHLHTEAGHILLDYNDREWLCGCGNYGCAEAYLSGKNFTKKMSERLKLRGLTGEVLVARARSGDKIVIREFQVYGERLAAFLYSLVVTFSPEKVIVSGGFSNSTDLFLPATQLRLKSLLKSRRAGIDLMPKIVVSKFRDEIGLLGAAKVALTEI